jgi:inner membrane protein
VDNLTHTLTGVALARLGLDKKVEGATLTLALACNLPDIDIVTGFAGSAAYLEHHRAITHAFPASPFLAAGLALVLSKWPRSRRTFRPTFFLAWLGICVHIVEDLWTSYGTRALLPFDSRWYSWDWIFIVDPTLLILLAAACFGPSLLKRPVASRWAVAAVLGYIGLRAGTHSLALGQAQSLAGSEFTLVRAFPDPIALNRWRFLASNHTTFASGAVQAIGTSRTKVAVARAQPDTLVSRIARESRMARVFLDFSAFPRLETRKDGNVTTIVWRDMRFADRRADGFLCEVKVDPTGKIVSERIVF